ncbi:MAG: alcohol dehydrogenase catalytic domain-containing protein [Candidatus Pacebacteria bacterium]|nr:alcohol dehydrogenase catalytic domain-containing protein [Candidatus Paceibacterota bacterium]
MDFPSTYISSSLKDGKVEVKQIPFLKEKLTSQTIVVKPMYMGLCRADIKEVASTRDIPGDRGPLFGHEFVGEIIFSGDQTGYNQGQIVTFNPNITPKRTTGFAQYFFIEGDKDTLERTLTLYTKTTPLDPPWLSEPFACIVHCVDVLSMHLHKENYSGDKVGIIGAGNSGLMFGMMLRSLGAEVSFYNRGIVRREFAVDKGFFSKEQMKSFNSINGDKDQYYIVVLVPTKIDQTTLQYAVDLVKENGTILLYGGTRRGDVLEGEPQSVDIDRVRRNENYVPVTTNGKHIFISGGYGCTRADFEKAIALYSQHHEEFPLDKLISRVIRLEDLPQLINTMAFGSVDYPGKVLILS